MIDPNRLARLFLDEWQDTEQPIEQRGTILPLGIYEDGSAHLAVPGLVQDGIEGWNALWNDAQAAREGTYPTFDEDQGKRSAGNSLMAAGLAATGGLAAGAAGGLPDNALASNAMRGWGDRSPAAVNALEDQAPKGIRAYHGSPHDFDRFDMSKIGTGEGAQAYGHGLYFAENEGVARTYRDSLSRDMDWDNDAHRALRDHLISLGHSKSVANDAAFQVASRRRSGRHPADGVTNEPPAFYDALNDAIKSSHLIPETGRMYEVNIKANPEDFLDWDLPLAQQSEKVRATLGQLGLDGEKSVFDALNEAAARRVGKGTTEGDFRRAELEGTNALRESGIPGIRYKDAMSRGGEGGTNNYVVFDDALVEILRKYANPPTAATVPLGLSGQNESDDDFLSAFLSRYGVDN